MNKVWLTWTGFNKALRSRKKISGATFPELFTNLVNSGIIKTCDYDPFEVAVLKKLGKSIEDYESDDIFDTEKYYKDIESVTLTDEEFYYIIFNNIDRIYEQKIFLETSDNEYKIDRLMFDENGKFIFPN